MRRVKFRPGLRQQLTANAAYLAAMSPGGVLPADLQRSLDATMPPPKKQRAAPRQLEAPVVQAISELLAVHPRVIWAARFNSGAASYEVAGYDGERGRYAPVWFHKFVRMPEKMRMPDFFGLVHTDAKCNLRLGGSWPIAIEAKAPGWTKPRDDREREQAAFLKMIRNAGGIGIFATSAEDVAAALK